MASTSTLPKLQFQLITTIPECALDSELLHLNYSFTPLIVSRLYTELVIYYVGFLKFHYLKNFLRASSGPDDRPRVNCGRRLHTGIAHGGDPRARQLMPATTGRLKLAEHRRDGHDLTTNH
ncbi:hypothetical protein EVAR_82277_1 [Eumeta japonica]|uniref:Uncharacterized protein n=1 Tax=Eumeta variegata TaxID=151549 RepID=A0A4C1W1B2_EUMVA|nr:hypothetical protein EVAR_82277_1 [Eumeta japonica]